MRTFRLALIVITLQLFAICTFAQTGRLFDTDNQLSSNFVNDIFQDRRGFIWIGTRNGLNVYDGYRFTVFGKGDRGLSSNYVTAIGNDREGRVILGTNNSLCYFSDGSFHDIPVYDRKGNAVSTYIKHLLLLRGGDVLVSTSGFGLLRMSTVKGARPVKGVEHLLHVASTFEDSQGRIWLVTENMELHRIEKSGRLTSHFAGLEGRRVMSVVEDKRGTFYVASREDGVFVMKKGERSFSRISAINGLSIYCLHIARDGQLYIASNGQGLHVYNPQTGLSTANPFFTRQTDLSRAKVVNIIEDQQGNIWLGLLQKGVFMQPVHTQRFSYMGYRLGQRSTIGENCVNNVLLSRGGQMWVGTDQDGLYQLDAQGRLLRHHTAVPATIMSLCEDPQGRIWIGTYREGCGWLDQSGGYHPVDLKQGPGVSVLDIKCDSRGTFWLATLGNGLLRLGKDGSVKAYKMRNRADEHVKENSLNNDFVPHLALSPDERRLYVATCFGLGCLDIEKDSWTSAYGVNNLHRGSYSICVYADRKGRVWYATNDSVFCHTPDRPLQPRVYSMADGLPSNGASSFAEDALGRIWMGTPHGLCCLDPRTGKTENFYVENGAQGNEFSDRAASALQGGRLLLFGGTGGINWFDPLKVEGRRWTAQVHVDDALLGNRFEFEHDESSFTLRLSTLTYGNVEQIAYAYSINGDEWHRLQPGVSEMAFSHLPAGKYKFRVKALNNGQETPVREFTVTVHPAWYATWWARLLYLCVLAYIIYWYIRHRRKKEQARLLLQQHIHAEEMGEAKLRFFMNISHEVRTPLTLILTPLLSLIKDDRDPRRQSVYDLMRKNAERILHLINQMMDLRKIDKGQMAMRMSETDLVAFTQNQYELFQHQAKAKNIDFSFTHDTDALPVWIDRQNFDKVLMNVLSNAFKFTPTGGHITLALTHTAHHVHLSVKDSGCGIPKDKLETIFQRFYQSPTTAADRNVGTGIGLDLTRSLVELHYGTITARNNEGEPGSEFLIRLPLGSEHLKPEEMVTDAEEQPVEQLVATEEEEAEVLPADGQVASSQPTIAVVEDEDDIRDYLREQLSAKYRVIAFADGQEAWPELVRQQPALVISDVMMPRMDGNTLCHKLKGNINTNHIPIILLTAKSREEDELEGLEMGADAYITKPFNMDILRRTVINLLAVRQTMRYKFSGQEGQEDKVERAEMASPNDKLMERIMQVVNDNIDDADLSIDLLAEQVGISRVHLHRKMKELTNQTPHNFIRNIRLRRAADLLGQGRQNVQEVMYACGFSNAASFSTMFKAMYGVSPREYMKTQER